MRPFLNFNYDNTYPFGSFVKVPKVNTYRSSLDVDNTTHISIDNMQLSRIRPTINNRDNQSRSKMDAKAVGHVRGVYFDKKCEKWVAIYIRS